MILVSHPLVNQFNRSLVEALADAGRLECFHTTLAKGRRQVRVPPWRVVQHPMRETVRLAAMKLGINWLTRPERGWASWEAVFQNMDRSVSRRIGKASAVYAYEDGALETFRAAKARGIPCFYDLPIAFVDVVQKLLREEAERLPTWEPTLGSTRDSEKKIARKRAEMDLADLVICPSKMVQDSLPGGKKSLVAEFGSPVARPIREERDGPLRVVFAGAMTQRKGLADLLAAFRMLDTREIQLVVLGAPVAEMSFYRNQGVDFEHHGPRPHAEFLQTMQSCDVLALPSIIEGRALVQQEAMSCGLPILVTRNAGGEDLVVDGLTGFLVPIRSPQRIAEKLDWFARHRGELPAMRRAAQQHAGTLTWARYAALVMESLP